MTALSPLSPGAPRSRWTSLRVRLIASHLAVILLALSLILVISAVSLGIYAREVEVDRLRDLAVPLVAEAQLLLAPGRDRLAREAVAEVLTNQAAAMEIRLLVLDREGVVRFDSASGDPPGENLEGRPLTAFTGAVERVLARAALSGLGRIVARPGEGENPFGDARVVFAAGGRRAAAPAVVALVAPVTAAPVLGRLLPPLLLTLAASLALASLAGYLLSRWIAAPIERVTAATGAMAEGSLDQAVPGEGGDELGRLVASFNAMSRRVAATARAQRDLLANVAHELRTPLTSVRGYSQALRDEVINDPVERQAALSLIGSEAERMGRLIGRLLDLARLESGQTRLAMGGVPAAPLLVSVRDRLRPEAERAGVHTRIDVAEGLVIWGDAERLTQVLENLATNALRATPMGGEITLGAAAKLPGARLWVKDTGAGIAPERLAGLFDRFARGDLPEGTGFGLGLAIVRELVTAHGGTVVVASELNAGTTVTVELPGGPPEPNGS